MLNTRMFAFVAAGRFDQADDAQEDQDTTTTQATSRGKSTLSKLKMKETLQGRDQRSQEYSELMQKHVNEMLKSATTGADLASYLENVYLGSLSKKLTDRDNHMLLSEMVQQLKDGRVKVASEEETLNLVNKLVDCLDCLERDPEHCSSRYHVKLELSDALLSPVKDLDAL